MLSLSCSKKYWLVTGLLLFLFENLTWLKIAFSLKRVGQKWGTGKGLAMDVWAFAVIPPSNWDFGVNCWRILSFEGQILRKKPLLLLLGISGQKFSFSVNSAQVICGLSQRQGEEHMWTRFFLSPRCWAALKCSHWGSEVTFYVLSVCTLEVDNSWTSG